MKQARASLNENDYFVVASAFQDVIQIFVHKNAKITKTFRCQLSPHPGGVVGDRANVEPKPLIGARDDDVASNVFAETIASLVQKQSPDESRLLVIGMGNLGPSGSEPVEKSHREELLLVLKLVQDVCVW